MKTAMIAMLPAMLLCSAAQAQLGGVTDTAGSAVEQAGDPALAGEFGQTGTDFTTSRIGTTRAGMAARQAREARRAARRAGNASETTKLEAQSQAAIQSEINSGSVAANSEITATTYNETVQIAETAAQASANAAPSGEASLDAAVQQQLAEIQASSTTSTQLASPPIPRASLAPVAPAQTRTTHVEGSTAPANSYHTTRRETVIVREAPPASPAPSRPVAAAEIRIESQSEQRAAPARSTNGSAQNKTWPLIMAGLLIALLLGFARQFGQGSRSA